jgi:hypothetical protein
MLLLKMNEFCVIADFRVLMEGARTEGLAW